MWLQGSHDILGLHCRNGCRFALMEWGAGGQWLPVRMSNLGCIFLMAAGAHRLWFAGLLWRFALFSGGAGKAWLRRMLAMGCNSLMAAGFAPISGVAGLWWLPETHIPCGLRAISGCSHF